MAILGHVCAEMSLRYGRLFDTTIRDEYERALDLAKTRIGSLPQPTETKLEEPQPDWRATATLKTALAGGHCLRAPPKDPAPTPTSASTAPASTPTPTTSPP